MVGVYPDIAYSAGNGGSADPPLKTTFDDDGPRNFYERITVTGIQEYHVQGLGGLAVELATYAHDIDAFPRDTFEPQRLGGVAMDIDNYMREMRNEN